LIVGLTSQTVIAEVFEDKLEKSINIERTLKNLSRKAAFWCGKPSPRRI
jgi:hypothetical protein